MSTPEFEPDDEDPEPPEDPIVETTTIDHATVVIHAHPWQQPVDVITETLDVQILADAVVLNGISFDNPSRALTIADARVCHDPRKGTVEILSH